MVLFLPLLKKSRLHFGIGFLLASLFLISCREAKKKFPVPENTGRDSIPRITLDTLKPFVQTTCLHYYTAIHPYSIVDSTAEIKSSNGNSFVLEFRELSHCPDTYDDQVWIDVFICVRDSNQLALNTDYHIPNKNIYIKSVTGGAWMSPVQFERINGDIRFESRHPDSCLVRLIIKGDIQDNRTKKRSGQEIFSNQLSFYKFDLSHWEWAPVEDSIYRKRR